MDPTGLLTDRYELTMVQAALRSGYAHRRSVFEMYARRLPDGRRYGVVAGTGRLLDAVSRFRFDDDQLDWLRENRIVDDRTVDWLADYRFTADIWGYGEGETYWPGSPILIVESGFAEGVLLETLALSILNHDSAIASAAVRMNRAAEGRPCIEMGSRRTHELAAVAAARAAYIVGFASTSNLEAGRRYGLPTAGTAAHSFTLLHDSERGAFQAQVDSLGKGTTLLVDTYDIATAVRTAVDVAGPGLGAIRLDSGDLSVHARRVRRELDELGATATHIVVTGDLDEFSIAALAGAPVDGYGVGTSLVTGSGHPTCGFVYKLVARASSDTASAPLVPVAKHSENKRTLGGRKWAARQLDLVGTAVAEIVGAGPEPRLDRHRRLLRPLVQAGEIVGDEPLSAARGRCERAVAELPLDAAKLSRGEPAIPTRYVGELASVGS